MRQIPADQFLAWVRERQIGPDERYPHSNSFSYRLPSDHWQCFDAPSEAFAIPRFVADVLDAAGAWAECLAWPRAQNWVEFSVGGDPTAGLYSLMLAGADIPSGFAGAIAFNRLERMKLIAAASAPLLFGLTVWEDILLFPDHGELYIQLDHHRQVTITCARVPATTWTTALCHADGCRSRRGQRSKSPRVG